MFSPGKAYGRVPVLGPTSGACCLAPPPGKWHESPHLLLQGRPRSFAAGVPFLSLGCRDKSPNGPALPSLSPVPRAQLVCS